MPSGTSFVAVHLAAHTPGVALFLEVTQPLPDADRAFHQVGAITVIPGQALDIRPVGLDRGHLLAILIRSLTPSRHCRDGVARLLIGIVGFLPLPALR